MFVPARNTKLNRTVEKDKNRRRWKIYAGLMSFLLNSAGEYFGGCRSISAPENPFYYGQRF
jgi:hypothetical protein